MPSTLHAYPELGLIQSRFTDTVDDDALINHYRRLLKTGREFESFRELVDFRAATEVKTTSTGLMTVGSMIGNAYKEVKSEVSAVFVAPQALTYGMVRMYEMLSSPDVPSIQLHRTLDAALDALEIDSPEHRTLIETASDDHPSVVWNID